MSSMNDFQLQLQKGRIGEEAISKYMVEKRGCSVLSVYEMPGGDHKGPRLLSPERDLVVPDLFVFRDDKVMWIETKTKSVFSWHRISKRWTTGIDLHHYRDYLRIQELHSPPVWLLFLHLQSKTTEHDGNSPTGLYGGSLSYLAGHENHRHDGWGRHGMVYWAEETLTKIAGLVEVMGEQPNG